MTRKGVYQYNYVDGPDKLLDSELPSRDKFYNRLTDTECSVEDYEHAQNVWNKFKMKSLREYHDLYMKTDVLLLADVFQDFRHFCLVNYELDPVHFLTSPGLSFAACMKMTEA